MSTDPDEVPSAFPKGPHGYSPDVVAASQRSRILHAIADVVAERGYADTSVANVLATAGVSRKTFYEMFSGKDDCFAAAFDEAQRNLAQAIIEATLGVQGPAERLEAGYRALCTALAGNPSMARIFIVAAPEAGRVVAPLRARWIEGSVQRLRRLYADTIGDDSGLPSELAEYIARAVVGAVDALITHHAETEGVESLPRLVPRLVEVAETLMYNLERTSDEAR
ncbi:TetR/AcrR family transcriptional regulator [Nocardia sp. NPDC051833]|uniref:TetR/AcrR family transcriptional regulator n=1 Tax=Nocardia sp. NPDC051833 TaxID=3155674 RepID=UPI00342D6D78